MHVIRMSFALACTMSGRAVYGLLTIAIKYSKVFSCNDFQGVIDYEIHVF